MVVPILFWDSAMAANAPPPPTCHAKLGVSMTLMSRGGELCSCGCTGIAPASTTFVFRQRLLSSGMTTHRSPEYVREGLRGWAGCPHKLVRGAHSVVLEHSDVRSQSSCQRRVFRNVRTLGTGFLAAPISGGNSHLCSAFGGKPLHSRSCDCPGCDRLPCHRRRAMFVVPCPSFISPTVRCRWSQVGPA